MSTKPSRRYWWVVASENETDWHWQEFFDHPNDNCKDWGGSRGIKAHLSCKYIKNDMRRGDVIVAYQAGSGKDKGVLGLVYLQSDGRYDEKKRSGTFDLMVKPRVHLDEPVPLKVIRNKLRCARDHIDFIKCAWGTVFAITPEGFKGVLKLMREYNRNPKRRAEVRDFLARDFTAIRQAPIVASDYLGDLKTPLRAVLTTARVIRDGKVSKGLKTHYNFECQVCGKAILLPDKNRYAEAHHLKPVGKPHNGPDGEPNTIVVCPHHHALFDLCAIAINPVTLKLEHWNQNPRDRGHKLILKHKLNKACLRYHYKMFKRVRG